MSATVEEQQGFTAETFRFWASPDLSTPSDDLANDVIGYWPGTDG